MFFMDYKNIIIIICVLAIIIATGIAAKLYFTKWNNICENMVPEVSQNAPSFEELEKSIKPEGSEISEIKDSQSTITLYYASWCGYSKMFLPEWLKFEEYAKNNIKHLKTVKINCEGGNESICFQKDIKGYPTVILEPKNRSEVEFSGERNLKGLIDFVNQNV